MKQLYPMRINKYLSYIGVTTRRQADKMIEEGRVNIDKTIAQLGDKVNKNSRVTLDKTNVSPNKFREKESKVWMFYKPKGCLTTREDTQGRPTVYEAIEKVMESTFAQNPSSIHDMKTIGRLDMNSEGLLLLTNDGQLKRYLELPQSRIERVYLVKISGNVSDRYLQQIQDGAVIDGTKYGKLKIYIHKRLSSSKCWIKVHLFEGKNREIRRLMSALNLHVISLKRIQHGPYVMPKSFKPNNITPVEVAPSLIKLAHTIEKF
eukprot:CAMPEP_0117425386 /NCGR_PEP_ID=MMETSP0758-20121206/5649_1 /TAXON_ID=63605 /ORGANISM="Percolomonas cosmopolitus, Strain AE-1 (ATCC 50343)" /LENGTH=261 /DNA_ID=CAMNT_0005209801 /DNA_START=226 /DNA_END=1011 /DNA_ORIENTATION=-